MKERPILFSAPMVRAILAGTKVQTRRVVKPGKCPDFGCRMTPSEIAGDEHPERMCPLGQPGDLLWVRETHAITPHPSDLGLTRENIPGTWDGAVAAAGRVIYAADPGAEIELDGQRWRSSIHMPRAASRITLEITGVRVERLQDMEGQSPYPGESDALAEGVNRIHHGRGDYYFSSFRNEPHPKNWCDPADAFRELWESINGTGSWDANPWVWVVAFKRVDSAA